MRNPPSRTSRPCDRSSVADVCLARRACGRFLTIALMTMLMPVVAVAQEQPTSKPKKRDSDLARKLIDKAASDSDEDVMATIMRIMRDVAQRLEIRFDPGEETQGAQQRIVEKLDEAIKIAGSRRRPTRSRSNSKSADKRRMHKPREGEPSKRSDGQAKAADDTSSPRTDSVKPMSGSGRYGKIRETRRTWGNLPMRDRDQIIQGVGEQYLERYRAWIERYYRALQESDE